MANIAKPLKIDTTVKRLHEGASKRECVTYKQICEVNQFNTRHLTERIIGDHLWDVVVFAANSGWPVLSAMAVPEKDKSTGLLTGSSLNGFERAIVALKCDFEDAGIFQYQQQQRCFDDWTQDGWKRR